MRVGNISANKALEKLITGNNVYVASNAFVGDVSQDRRIETCKFGQKPYAIVITCSDSRVIPEVIFSAGIGDLFVIRVAGNVIGDNQLGSIEYAAEHLGCKLAVVLGHTDCGAVAATCDGAHGNHVMCIIDEIRRAIGNEKDKYKANILNIKQSVTKIENDISIDGFKVVGAIYDIENGKTIFDNI